MKNACAKSQPQISSQVMIVVGNTPHQNTLIERSHHIYTEPWMRSLTASIYTPPISLMKYCNNSWTN